jgi:hypothetical protein
MPFWQGTPCVCHCGWIGKTLSLGVALGPGSNIGGDAHLCSKHPLPLFAIEPSVSQRVVVLRTVSATLLSHRFTQIVCWFTLRQLLAQGCLELNYLRSQLGRSRSSIWSHTYVDSRSTPATVNSIWLVGVVNVGPKYLPNGSGRTAGGAP